MSDKILIVDDEAEIADLIEVYLSNENFTVLKFYSAKEALECINTTEPDLAILDIMLPEIDGFTLCQKIRSKHTYPIIMLTAKDEETDKITGLTLGADDYITKPFDTNELLARISVQLRSGACGGELTYDDITLNVNDFTVTAGGKPVKLTKTEYAILLTLLKSKGKPVTKERIMSEIESKTPDCEENSLRTHVGNLRQKLKTAGGKDYIEAIWGIGYKLKS